MPKFKPVRKTGPPVELVEKPVKIAVSSEVGYKDVTASVRALPNEWPVPITLEKVLLLKEPALSIVMRT